MNSISFIKHLYIYIYHLINLNAAQQILSSYYEISILEEISQLHMMLN